MHCDKCKKRIYPGNGYVSLNYNIENLNHDVARNSYSIGVISSENVLTLCGTCGNRFNAAMARQVLGLLVKPQRPRHN